MSHLIDSFLHLVLVLKHVDHVEPVLDDKSHDGYEGQQQHLGQVDLLAAPCRGVQAAAPRLDLHREWVASLSCVLRGLEDVMGD